jgi:hypothetical protein
MIYNKEQKNKNKLVLYYSILFILNSLTIHSQTEIYKIENTIDNDLIVKKYGLQLSKSYVDGESKIFLENIQPSLFLKKIVFKNEEDNQLSKFNKKFKTDYNTKIKSFPNGLINCIKKGDFYNFVSYHFDPLDKTYHLIFRYYSESNGLDYHDYRLVKTSNKIIIDDIYIYSNCQKLSETFKLYYLTKIPKKSISSISNTDNYKYILILKNYVDAIKNNQLKKAYKHISILNNTLSYNDRFTAMLKLSLSDSISEEAYFDTMEDILNHFKLDPSINLTAIKYHYLNKDYDAVFKSINNIENHTNDTFLDFEKANLYFNSNNYESAIIYYKNMIKNYPYFHLPKFSLLVIYENEKKYKNATELLNTILETSSFQKKSLVKKVNEQLPFLSKSNEYKKWCDKK